MNSHNIIKLINKASGSPNKTKDILLNCTHTVINKDKITIKYIIDDINNFLKWISNTNISNTIANNINSLNINNMNSEELLNYIDNILEDILGDKLYNLRVRYDIYKILKWINKDTYELERDIDNYFNTNPNEEDIFDDLDNIFMESSLNNTYEYYDNLYRLWNKRNISRDLHKLLSERIEIKDKYGVNQDISAAAHKIKKKYEKGPKEYIPHIIIDDEKLQKIQNIISGGLDTQLKLDMEELDKITNTLSITDREQWNIKDAWKDVYLFLLREKLKPGKKRYSLYILLIYLILDIPIQNIINNAKNIGINNIDIKDAYKIFVKMTNLGYLSEYKDKLDRLINPIVNLNKLVIYLTNINIPEHIIDTIINQITYKFSIEQNLSLHKQIDIIIYDILKSNNIKITRKNLNIILQ